MVSEAKPIRIRAPDRSVGKDSARLVDVACAGLSRTELQAEHSHALILKHISLESSAGSIRRFGRMNRTDQTRLASRWIGRVGRFRVAILRDGTVVQASIGQAIRLHPDDAVRPVGAA